MVPRMDTLTSLIKTTSPEFTSNRDRMMALLGELKSRTGIKVYDPAREGVVLEHISQLNKGPLSKGAVEEIFAAIMTACREIQSK